MKTLLVSLAFLVLIGCSGGSELITIEDDDNLIALEEAELVCIISGGDFVISSYEDLETGVILYEGRCDGLVDKSENNNPECRPTEYDPVTGFPLPKVCTKSYT